MNKIEISRDLDDNDKHDKKKKEEKENNIFNIEKMNDLYVEDDFEMLSEKDASEFLGINSFFVNLRAIYKRNITLIKWTMLSLVLGLYVAYFVWSMVCNSRKGLHNSEDNITLIWLSCVLLVYVMYRATLAFLLWRDIKMALPDLRFIQRVLKILYYLVTGATCLVLCVYTVFFLGFRSPHNMVSIVGIVCLLLFSCLLSKAPHMINWGTIISGLILQLIFAFLIITTHWGYLVFKFLGDKVSELLTYADFGSNMVFGNSFPAGNFAFRVLPMIFFLSSVISALYYLGAIQVVIVVLGTIMQFVMGTTCGESLNAAANIFLGMVESPLCIKPLLGIMTNSELHAVMTCGFATIAGGVLGVYVSLGIPASHLISASVMSAPAALAISKLIYPETKKSKNTKDDAKKLPKSPYHSVIEALIAGASDSVTLIGSIAANLIAFVSLLAFCNSVLEWLGKRICINQKLSFELICSYIFWPLSLVMGVDVRDCRKVAELNGIKIFLNEFIAYAKLATLIKNGKIYRSLDKVNLTISRDADDIIIEYINGTTLRLEGGIMHSHRSVIIASYSLCGFSNFGSVGILLSALSSMIPHRRSDLSKMVIRAMVAGNIACFLTACIAGLFYDERRKLGNG